MDNQTLLVVVFLAIAAVALVWVILHDSAPYPYDGDL